MNDIKVNQIVFCPDDYKDDKFGDYDREAMFKDVATTLNILLKLGYDCKVWDDSYCTVIDYDYADEQLTPNTLAWVNLEDYENYLESDYNEPITEDNYMEREEYRLAEHDKDNSMFINSAPWEDD